MPSPVLIPKRMEAAVWCEGTRVVFRLSVAAGDMPPQAAVDLANRLHAAAREAKANENLAKARKAG